VFRGDAHLQIRARLAVKKFPNRSENAFSPRLSLLRSLTSKSVGERLWAIAPYRATTLNELYACCQGQWYAHNRRRSGKP